MRIRANPVRHLLLTSVMVAMTFAFAQPWARAGCSAPWRAPLAGPVHVMRPFLAPTGPYARGHRGVDLAASVGDRVYAAGAGRISFAGPVAGHGVVAIDHGNGLRTTYEPVDPSLAVGQGVRPGDPIGVLARPMGHCGPFPCLHWGLRRAQRYLDPLTLLSPPGDWVLLPFLEPERERPKLDVKTRSAAGGAASIDHPAPPVGGEANRTSSGRGRVVAAGGLVALAVGAPALTRARGGLTRSRRVPSRQLGA
jgi:hypothetical protein